MKPIAPDEFRLPQERAPRLTRRRFILRGLQSIAALGLAGLATAGYGVGEALSLAVRRYRLTPPGWPATQRLTIAVIADLHAGGPNMGLGHIRQIVDLANLLKPDLTLLLGDYFATHRFITERVPHEVWAEELSRLTAPLGTWAVLGNHDWWYDVDGARGALARVGIPLMENEARLLGPSGRQFWLAGLGDQLAHRLGPNWYKGEDDLPGTLRQVGHEHPVILMAHEPDIFPQVPERVSLTISGHTHGGQIRIPFLWPRWVPSMYGSRFAYGHIVEEKRHLIVSGGLGTSIVPMRIGMPPEIVHIELGA